MRLKKAANATKKIAASAITITLRLKTFLFAETVAYAKHSHMHLLNGCMCVIYRPIFAYAAIFLVANVDAKPNC